MDYMKNINQRMYTHSSIPSIPRLNVSRLEIFICGSYMQHDVKCQWAHAQLASLKVGTAVLCKINCLTFTTSRPQKVHLPQSVAMGWLFAGAIHKMAATAPMPRSNSSMWSMFRQRPKPLLRSAQTRPWWLGAVAAVTWMGTSQLPSYFSQYFPIQVAL